MNGIHEVTGSIPVSSTNSDNDLARSRIGGKLDPLLRDVDEQLAR